MATSESNKFRVNIHTHTNQKALLILTQTSDLTQVHSQIQAVCKNKLGLKSINRFTLLSGNNLTICVSAADTVFDFSHVSQKVKKADQCCCPSAPIQIIGQQFSGADVISELTAIAQKPGVVHVLALPDLSAAVPCPVGTSISVRDRIYPSWIGTDIGCGVSLFKLCSKQQGLNPRAIEKMKKSLESGYTDKWSIDQARKFRQLVFPCPSMDISKHDETFGSIGAGNHFCELQECVKSQDLYLTVHSGSRSLGVDLSQRGEIGEDPSIFLKLQQIGIEWARWNRLAIAKRVIQLIQNDHSSVRFDHPSDPAFDLVIDICHNFIEQDSKDPGVYIHRKGAIPTNLGPVLIPGSRGTHSYLVESITTDINSLPHGAGRKYTKNDAEKRFSELNRDESLKNHVICNDKKLFAQESPGAYKDIDEVMQHLENEHWIQILQVFNPLLTLKYNGL